MKQAIEVTEREKYNRSRSPINPHVMHQVVEFMGYRRCVADNILMEKDEERLNVFIDQYKIVDENIKRLMNL